MKIEMLNVGDFKIESQNDLNKIIPGCCTGTPLNYGQGEGQVMIDGTVWGIYVCGNNGYTLQFEEGNLAWERLSKVTTEILSHLRSTVGEQVTFSAVGVLDHYKDHEKYT